MLNKIKNPTAKPVHIALALLYIVVITALFVCAIKSKETSAFESAQVTQTSNS